jgi:NAD(P)-dependent dehydrogenase (short-subunit alcohol dehydrogenase family)
MAKWTAANIPDQTGRTAIVTGANSGIGAVTARELARAGAHVILACRNVAKAHAAAATMPGSIEVRELDLANLSSIHTFAATIPSIDILINNAGIMAVPFGRTADGFEMQIGTNHLGPFALTGLLLNRVRDRVVTVSSVTHRLGQIRLHDLNWEHGPYQRWPAYTQSKLANLLFTYELARRLTTAHSPVLSVAAHPGYTSTNLQSHTESFQDHLMSLGNHLLAQSPTMGALPTLYAATMALPTTTFIAPNGPFQLRGHPKPLPSNRASHNPQTATHLWTLSESLTHTPYKFTP